MSHSPITKRLLTKKSSEGSEIRVRSIFNKSTEYFDETEIFNATLEIIRRHLSGKIYKWGSGRIKLIKIYSIFIIFCESFSFLKSCCTWNLEEWNSSRYYDQILRAGEDETGADVAYEVGRKICKNVSVLKIMN